MVERNITHASFTVVKSYPAKPSRVFRAFSDMRAKEAWFHGPDEWTVGRREFDFRVGGREVQEGGPEGGQVHLFVAVYQDIVANERIVYSYEMQLDAVRISVSLATIEFKPEGDGTRLVLTEHGAFLDGYDDCGSREAGTTILLGVLGDYLSRQLADA